MFRLNRNYATLLTRTLRKQSTKVPRRLYSSVKPEAPAKPASFFYRQRLLRGVSIGLLAGLGWGLYSRHNDRVIRNDEVATMQPKTNCQPFPTSIEVGNTKFQILGVGVRSVTFMHFHVYGAGMYIASDDIEKARKLLKLENFEPHDVSLSTHAINTLLLSNIRFALRIEPVRNTDFQHLRDGFVRAIIHHELYKELGGADSFAHGLVELKKGLTPRRKVPKGDILTFVSESDGSMRAYHSEGGRNDMYALLTHVSSPDLTRIFFLNYMSGYKPPSPSLKESTQNGLVSLL